MQLLLELTVHFNHVLIIHDNTEQIMMLNMMPSIDCLIEAGQIDNVGCIADAYSWDAESDADLIHNNASSLILMPKHL
jgi:hypothetical protein